ncbi:ROK family protein, partial [Salinibacterium sp.]|uniref:ROK family protein n=1 Tax=Salinibacterium sp. TaxID=1915057 RepID=UPI00286C1D2D
QLDFLAIALCNVVNIFNPERIILGGFLASLFQLNPERLTLQVASRALHGPREVATITRAVLGSSLLMIGAAELALAPLLADPAGVSALTAGGVSPRD